MDVFCWGAPASCVFMFCYGSPLLQSQMLLQRQGQCKADNLGYNATVLMVARKAVVGGKMH